MPGAWSTCSSTAYATARARRRDTSGLDVVMRINRRLWELAENNRLERARWYHHIQLKSACTGRRAYFNLRVILNHSGLRLVRVIHP
jgi:hypothetical protein